MKFTIDQNDNFIFDGTLREVQQMYCFIDILRKKEQEAQDKNLFNLLKDIKIEEKNEKKD